MGSFGGGVLFLGAFRGSGKVTPSITLRTFNRTAARLQSRHVVFRAYDIRYVGVILGQWKRTWKLL